MWTGRVGTTPLERTWTLSDRKGDYGPLVTPTGNSEEPIHRWFHFKEGYSHGLVGRLFKDAAFSPKPDGFAVCDPFVGCGTTLVSAISIAREIGVPVSCLGVERNPAIHIIASAKVRGVRLGRTLRDRILRTEKQFWDAYASHKQRWQRLSTASATLNNADYYQASYVRSLLALGRAAAAIDDPDVRDIYQACVASAVEPAGMLRRDGRALRYTPTRCPADPVGSFQLALSTCVRDVTAITNGSPHIVADVVLGDARNVVDIAEGRVFDWIICSPPYPNNIDYTEVYKAESWALELYRDPVDMKRQRLQTLRSHPSVLFPDSYEYQTCAARDSIESLIAPIIAAVPADRYERGRKQLVQGYVDDMFQVLAALRMLAAADGICALAVGNSVHGTEPDRFVIASDIILARLGEITGWHVDDIRIARALRRRGADIPHLRESVVILRNTNG